MNPGRHLEPAQQEHVVEEPWRASLDPQSLKSALKYNIIYIYVIIFLEPCCGSFVFLLKHLRLNALQPRFDVTGTGEL